VAIRDILARIGGSRTDTAPVSPELLESPDLPPMTRPIQLADPEAEEVPEPLPLSSDEEVADLSLDAFGIRALILKVWARILDQEIWFVSSEKEVQILQDRGVLRKEIFTAHELTDLLEVFQKDPEKACLVLEAKQFFGGSLQIKEDGTSAEELGVRVHDLDIEEALFRRYWHTLPDKRLAAKKWFETVLWFADFRELSGEAIPPLIVRCGDLFEVPEQGVIE